eukprot:jgi/Mesen1/3177/ME000184S02257
MAPRYVHVGMCKVSPDHRLLAYTLDPRGDERFVLFVKDLPSGALLEDHTVEGVVSVEWAADNDSFLYTLADKLHRPYRSDPVLPPACPPAPPAARQPVTSPVTSPSTRQLSVGPKPAESRSSKSSGSKTSSCGACSLSRRAGGRVMRRALSAPPGGAAGGGEGDEVVMEEAHDASCCVDVARTKDWRYLTLNCMSRTSSEARPLPRASGPQGSGSVLNEMHYRR